MSALCNTRHWFTIYGRVRIAAPFCQRCGVPNPKWSPKACIHKYGPRHYCTQLESDHDEQGEGSHRFTSASSR